MIHINNVHSIYSGYNYVCMSTSDRSVYYSSVDTQHMHLTMPKHINTLTHMNIVKLCCGTDCLTALVTDTSTGKQAVFFFNSNIEGIGDTTPITVDCLEEYRYSTVCDISCSDSCTLLLFGN